MANELIIIELLGYEPGCPISYTVADGAGIAKGTLMQLTDPRTASAHSGASQPIIGVAAAEKVASDGQTRLAVYTNGIFDVTAAAAGVTAIGNICMCSATANMITMANGAGILGGYVIGQALEAIANNEVGAVRILK
jgi:hypothetical protein